MKRRIATLHYQGFLVFATGAIVIGAIAVAALAAAVLIDDVNAWGSYAERICVGIIGAIELLFAVWLGAEALNSRRKWKAAMKEDET